MSARLGIPVEIWNPFENPAFDTARLAPVFLEENHPLLVTGIGLALKELIPVSARIAEKTTRFKNPLAKAA